MKMLLYKCMLLAFAAFFSLVAPAQSNIKFTHLTNMNGLSQSTVQAIIKDKYGFMWFGTQDGLNRYDGYSFKVYRHKPKDSTSLRKSHIMCMYEDSNGDLWVGTNNGALSLYDRKKDAFVHFKESVGDNLGLSQKTVTAIYEDKQKNFWIGTYWRLNLLDRKTGEITQFGNDPADPNSLSNDGINCIFEDSRNNLWVGTHNGLNLLDRKTKKFQRFFSDNTPGSISHNSINTIYEDEAGRLWIGTGDGLNLFDQKTKTFKRFQKQDQNPNSLGDNGVTAIQPAGKGKLWIGTKMFLDLFDIEKNTFTHFGSNPNVPTTLNKNGNVIAMYKDAEGTLWVATYQGGINKFDEHLTYFDIYQNNPNSEESLSFNIVTGFAENPDGDVWITTGGGALNLWQRSTNKFIRFNPDPNNKNSLANWGTLCVYQGKKNNYVWIGMYGNCVDRYDPKTNTFKHFTKGDRPDQLNNDAVYAVFEDSKGNIWMGTNGGGANVLDQSTGIITKYVPDPNDPKSISSNYIRCFVEDKDGQIWIGHTGGISIYNPVTKAFTNYNHDNIEIESDFIFSIYIDKKQNVWLGSLGGGLTKFNPRTKKTMTYTTDHGLADNTINGIMEDDLGHLWISTNNGLSRFDPISQVFKNSSHDNGIQSFEFSQNAILKTSEGELLFGGINGFNVIHPDQLIKNDHKPPVAITGFKLFNKPVVIGADDSPLKQNILETKQITLNYKQSIITFEFAALNFTASEKNQYAYKLEGFDKDWIHAGNNRSATYTNLNPGTYTFRVKASNNDGLWNEKGTSVKIIITPPFWQTWWFKTLGILALIGAVVLLYNFRVRAIHKQKRILEQQVKERTQKLEQMTMDERKARKEADEAAKQLEHKNKELEQFAYVASHDLQEPLRTISSFVNLLHQQYRGNFDDKADKYMSFIIGATDRMKTLINDLLEYSRIGRKKEFASIDCNELVKEVVSDLEVAIKEAGAEVSWEPLPTINAYRTEMKQILQNLITNAIKFRKKDTPPKITIYAERKEEHWQFSVKDNGIGIDPKHSERIFVIFQRLHTRTEYEGSGIGLSNCRKIAELHGGKIWVESKPGEGSNFSFTVKENIGVEQN